MRILSSKTIFSKSSFLPAEIWHLLFASDWRPKSRQPKFQNLYYYSRNLDFTVGPYQISKVLLAEFLILLFGPNQILKFLLAEFWILLFWDQTIIISKSLPVEFLILLFWFYTGPDLSLHLFSLFLQNVLPDIYCAVRGITQQWSLCRLSDL